MIYICESIIWSAGLTTVFRRAKTNMGDRVGGDYNNQDLAENLVGPG